MRTALTIAGSDSSGGAGIQADLKTFAAFGLYGASAITAITAQSTKGIEATFALPADLVTAQLEAVAGDLTLHATKIGMLANAAIAEAVAAAIAELDLPLVVVDPVLVSSSGERLLDEDGVRVLCTELFPLARVVTPNIPEAEALSGRIIHSLDDAYEAARRIQDMGAAAVIITGGHAFSSPPPASRTAHLGPRTSHPEPGSHPAPRTSHLSEVVDLLFDGNAFFELRVPRVDSRHTHGTGCTFASALAAGLALGWELPIAAGRAQEYVAGAIRHAPGLGHGHGPLDHFWGGILKR
ncbi:MAG: Bifunctional hydroxymethylpyrimidine kinase/phosphomethylpyrimidine kinase [Acidobacteria bacterium]|nr:Bifunctional hydroxymethylpyrimidine kinase/phosphomethylpyrimidine kinase [Acidobacteriota bacterium]